LRYGVAASSPLVVVDLDHAGERQLKSAHRRGHGIPRTPIVPS
jgi:hypothetical protein